MTRPPLKDMPPVETLKVDEEDLADHLKYKRKAGDPNPKKEVLDLDPGLMETNLPTVKGLSPEQLEGRTFLLPPMKYSPTFSIDEAYLTFFCSVQKKVTKKNSPL